MLYLFDFDGVLVDSLGFYEELVRTSLEDMGLFIVRGRQDYLDLFEDNFYESLRDRGVDVEMFNARARARAAGAKTVAVTWGWHSEEQLRKARPDAVVHHPSELIGLTG